MIQPKMMVVGKQRSLQPIYACEFNNPIVENCVQHIRTYPPSPNIFIKLFKY